MRTEHVIEQDLATARAAYLAAANVKPAPEVAALSDRVKALQAELGAALSEGATACDCGKSDLFGMLKRPGVYEVGCLGCGERSRGKSPAVAVEAWNAGARVPR